MGLVLMLHLNWFGQCIFFVKNYSAKLSEFHIHDDLYINTGRRQSKTMDWTLTVSAFILCFIFSGLIDRILTNITTVWIM